MGFPRIQDLCLRHKSIELTHLPHQFCQRKMSLPYNLVEYKSNLTLQHQNLMEFVVKSKLILMRRNHDFLRTFQLDLESVFTRFGNLFGLQSGSVQAFCACSSINLEEECRRFITLRRHFWYGKFLSGNIYLYVFVIGLPINQ